MNAPPEHSPRSRGAGLPIAEAIGTRRLIIAIVTMPIIAIAAVVLIILYAQDRPDSLDAAAATYAPAPIRLGAGARVVETVSDGKRLFVRTESPGGGEIAVYDIASGRRLHAIPIVRD